MLDIADGDRLKHQSSHYRAVLRTKIPRQIIADLAEKKIKTIIPIEDWELLGPSSSFPNANNLTQTTLSLPIYPSLTDKEVDFVLQQLNKYQSEFNQTTENIH